MDERRHSQLGTRDLAKAFADAALQGNRATFAEIRAEIDYRNKLKAVHEGLVVLGSAVIERNVARPTSGGEWTVAEVIHSVLGMGEVDADGATATKNAVSRVNELRKAFHPDKFSQVSDANVLEIANRFTAVLNAMQTALDFDSYRS